MGEIPLIVWPPAVHAVTGGPHHAFVLGDHDRPRAHVEVPVVGIFEEDLALRARGTSLRVAVPVPRLGFRLERDSTSLPYAGRQRGRRFRWGNHLRISCCFGEILRR